MFNWSSAHLNLSGKEKRREMEEDKEEIIGGGG